MTNLTIFIVFFLITNISFSQSKTPDENNVIVVYNSKSSFGNSIAEYYKIARKIPAQNIFRIDCDTSEVVYNSYFQNSILKPLRDSIDKRQDVNTQRFFLLLQKEYRSR